MTASSGRSVARDELEPRAVVGRGVPRDPPHVELLGAQPEVAGAGAFRRLDVGTRRLAMMRDERMRLPSGPNAGTLAPCSPLSSETRSATGCCRSQGRTSASSPLPPRLARRRAGDLLRPGSTFGIEDGMPVDTRLDNWAPRWRRTSTAVHLGDLSAIQRLTGCLLPDALQVDLSMNRRAFRPAGPALPASLRRPGPGDAITVPPPDAGTSLAAASSTPSTPAPASSGRCGRPSTTSERPRPRPRAPCLRHGLHGGAGARLRRPARGDLARFHDADVKPSSRGFRGGLTASVRALLHGLRGATPQADTVARRWRPQRLSGARVPRHQRRRRGGVVCHDERNARRTALQPTRRRRYAGEEEDASAVRPPVPPTGLRCRRSRRTPAQCRRPRAQEPRPSGA